MSNSNYILLYIFPSDVALLFENYTMLSLIIVVTLFKSKDSKNIFWLSDFTALLY